MPELPDIEVFKQYLDSTSLHQEIESVEVRNDEILGDYCSACQHDGRED